MKTSQCAQEEGRREIKRQFVAHRYSPYLATRIIVYSIWRFTESIKCQSLRLIKFSNWPYYCEPPRKRFDRREPVVSDISMRIDFPSHESKILDRTQTRCPRLRKREEEEDPHVACLPPLSTCTLVRVCFCKKKPFFFLPFYSVIIYIRFFQSRLLCLVPLRAKSLRVGRDSGTSPRVRE